MSEETPSSGEGPSPEPTTERTPSWPRRAAKVAADAAWSDLSDTGRRIIDTGRHRARGAWSRRPPRVAMVAWGFLAVLAGLGLASLGARSRVASALPTDLDWRAAAALLERDSQAGDAVVVAPAWAERARAELPARVPVFSLPSYEGEPLLGVRRVWLVSLSGLPFTGDRIARQIAARAASDGGAQRIGALAVNRYDLAQPSRAIAFLPDWLAQATARVGERPCERDGSNALRCPTDPPIRIAREVRELGGGPRPCVSGVAGSAESGPVVITFPAVPMGITLRGSAGFTGRAPSGGSAPVRVAVQVDGAEVAGLELTPGADAWKTFDTRTATLAAEPHAVSVVLSSSDPAGRTLCFDLWTLP